MFVLELKMMIIIPLSMIVNVLFIVILGTGTVGVISKVNQVLGDASISIL
jgi:hypothetical protein